MECILCREPKTFSEMKIYHNDSRHMSCISCFNNLTYPKKCPYCRIRCRRVLTPFQRTQRTILKFIREKYFLENCRTQRKYRMLMKKYAHRFYDAAFEQYFYYLPELEDFSHLPRKQLFIYFQFISDTTKSYKHLALYERIEYYEILHAKVQHLYSLGYEMTRKNAEITAAV
jgi:hypothetical protein